MNGFRFDCIMFLQAINQPNPCREIYYTSAPY
jgi:hypothetical protein